MRVPSFSAFARRRDWPFIVLSLALWVVGGAVSPVWGAGLVNDSLLKATTLSGESGTMAGTTQGAGIEMGEPNHAGLQNAGSVWYRWPAFTGGTASFQVLNATFQARIAVYRQTDSKLSFATLAPVTSQAAGSVQFTLQPGSAYFIAVANGLRGSGTFTLSWKHTAPAGGGVDLVMLPESVHANVITRGFGPLDCEVVNGCTTVGTNRIVAIDFEVANRGKEDMVLGNPTQSPWAITQPCMVEFHFPNLIRYTLRDGKNRIIKVAEPVEHCFTDARRENTAASVETRYVCLSQGLQAGWIHSSPSSLPCHFIDVNDVPAGAYTLEVTIDPYNWVFETNNSNNSAMVPVIIEPECSEPPSNDSRASAIVITGAIGTISGNSECATREPGERSHVSGSPTGRSVWYRWTAPSTADAVVSTEGSNFDTILEVQEALAEGAEGVNGPKVDGNDDAFPGSGYSQVAFHAVGGETYWFVVDGFNPGGGAQGGQVLLHLNLNANDDVATAELISGLVGAVSGTTVKSDKEPGEPNHGGNSGGHSVWFQWIAPAKGPASFKTDGSKFATLLGIYKASELSNLTPVPGTLGTIPGGIQLTFSATAGESYLIALDGRDGASGLYQLAWQQQPEVNAEVRLAARRESDGRLLLTITGSAGQIFTILRSTDLSTWTPVGELTLVTEAGEFTDPAPAGGSIGFYRAVAK